MDTDILSMFAKAEALEALIALTGSERIGMTPAIAEEIAAPLQYGYDFPLQVLSQLPVVQITKAVAGETIRLQTAGATLGRGEREAIAFCKVEKALFATNDAAARRFAHRQGVEVISLQALLRGLWVSGIKGKAEVKELLERIKRADRLEVSAEVEAEIFAEGEG